MSTQSSIYRVGEGYNSAVHARWIAADQSQHSPLSTPHAASHATSYSSAFENLNQSKTSSSSPHTLAVEDKVPGLRKRMLYRVKACWKALISEPNEAQAHLEDLLKVNIDRLVLCRYNPDLSFSKTFQTALSQDDYFCDQFDPKKSEKMLLLNDLQKSQLKYQFNAVERLINTFGKTGFENLTRILNRETVRHMAGLYQNHKKLGTNTRVHIENVSYRILTGEDVTLVIRANFRYNFPNSSDIENEVIFKAERTITMPLNDLQTDWTNIPLTLLHATAEDNFK